MCCRYPFSSLHPQYQLLLLELTVHLFSCLWKASTQWWHYLASTPTEAWLDTFGEYTLKQHIKHPWFIIQRPHLDRFENCSSFVRLRGRYLEICKEMLRLTSASTAGHTCPSETFNMNNRETDLGKIKRSFGVIEWLTLIPHFPNRFIVLGIEFGECGVGKKAHTNHNNGY